MMTWRKLEKQFERISFIRKLSIWWADRRAMAWHQRNPGKPFSDYYVDQVRDHLARGRPHPTLGNQGFTDEVGSRIEWDRANFAERGRYAWQGYRRAGVQSGMRCVDYGCGSLRVGQHAIRFLEAGNYWGIDVTESFIDEGRELIDPELLAAKRPRLSVIDDRLIDLIGVWEPHFIFSHAVLQHVPQAELVTYFDRLARMMGPGCRAAIEFIAAPATTRIKAMSWGYADEALRAAAATIDPALVIWFETVPCDDSVIMRKPRHIMILERPAETAAMAQGIRLAS